MSNKARAKITLVHANGHITDAAINMPDQKDLVTRVRVGEVVFSEIMEHVFAQMAPGSSAYLIIKSKHR